MASSWQSTVQGAENFSVEEQINKRIDSRGQRGTGENGGLFGLGGIDFGSNIVGINATKVPEMQSQIRDSVTALQNRINEIDAAADQDRAFRSEDIQTAVREYIEKVKEYCNALISDLNAFNDKLQVVREAWEKSSQSFASDQITADKNSSFSDNTTQYQEQFASGR